MPQMGFQDDYYLGGEMVGAQENPQAFSKYYQTQGGRRPYGMHGNPMLDQAAQGSNQRDLNDRQNLQDLYAQLQAQASGGITPQQMQQQQGFQQAAGMAGSAAMGAGGARARSANMGGIQQQAGIQGAQNEQQAGMLRAQDQIGAQNQMQQVAAMQRGQDLQSQGLTADDAYRQAQMELRARGMNTQRQLGYAGLESGALGTNMNAFLDAYRRSAKRGAMTQANKDQWLERSIRTAGTVAGMGV